MRARNIWGPYEQRVVLSQGSTKINGPHQGGYVETPSGEGWFVHFQSRGAHGRIVHLQPVRWENDWPEMGKPVAGQTAGEPVDFGPLPSRSMSVSHQQPQTSDEFRTTALGPQWEWNHNPEDNHWSLNARPGYMRLIPMNAADLLSARNTLTQCMQDNSFEFTAKVDLSGMRDGVHGGVAMFEKQAGGLEIVQSGTERRIYFFHAAERTPGSVLSQQLVQLRIKVEGDTASYSFSTDDGHSFQPLGNSTPITFSWWKGSRPSLFAYTTQKNAPGAVDVDWVHYEPKSEF